MQRQKINQVTLPWKVFRGEKEYLSLPCSEGTKPGNSIFNAKKRAISSCFTSSVRTLEDPLHFDHAELVTLLVLFGKKAFTIFFVSLHHTSTKDKLA